MRLSPATTRSALVAAATLALAALTFPGAVLRGEVFFERDLNFDWYLRLAATRRALLEGALPLWDPSVTFGQPLLADPGTQVLYPTTWLALVLPRAAGYTAFVVVHLLLTSIGAARLARAWGAGRTGAALAALAWAFSGPLQSLVNLRQHLAGAAWMPWALLAAEGVAVSPGLASGLALGAVLAAQILAGSADMCAMTWTLAAAWMLARARRRRRAVLAVAAWAASGALLSTAVVWVPALDTLRRSPRSDLTADVRETWSVPPAGLARLVAPLDPARVSPDVDTRRALFDRADGPFLASLYLGAPLLGLGAMAVARRPRPRAAPFLLLAGLGALAVSLGPHAAVYPVVARLVPALRILRYPSKAMLVVSLAASLLAGLGASALARRRFGRAAALLAAAGVVGAGLAGARASGAVGGPPAPSILAVAAGAAALLAASALGAARARVLAALLAGVCVADLAATHAGLHATAPERVFFTPPPLLSSVDGLAGRRLYVYDYSTLPDSSARHLGRPSPYVVIETPRGWSTRVFGFAALQSYLLPPWGALFGVPPAFEFDMRGLYSRELNDLTFFLRRVEGTPAHERLLSLAGVGAVVSLHRIPGLEPGASLPSLFPEPILVWRVPGDAGRARVVGCARLAAGPSAFAALGGPGFDPSAEVILARAPGPPGPCGPAGEARITRDGSDRVRLEVEASRPAFAVLADTWDPGWRATLDGRAVELLRANVTFRAVAVPAGRHVVEMTYRPRAASAGLAVSIAGLALAGLAAVALRQRGARRAAR